MTDDPTPQGPWTEALAQLRAWDPAWAEAADRIAAEPWRSAILPRKFVELVSIGLNAACTNLQPEATRRHIRAALNAGATREEIILVIKCATLMALHSCSLGAPILLEEAQRAGTAPHPTAPGATPAVDRMRQLGQWNTAWDPFFNLDPGWTDAFMQAGLGVYAGGIMPAKDIELLSIAFDASFTHMYAPGTGRHIKAALKAGATVEEIFAVLKLCAAHGVQAINMAVPILAEELERND